MRKLILFSALLLLAVSNSFAQSSHKYVPVEGKVLGVWPHNDRLKSLDKMKELKEVYGFNHVLLAAIYGHENLGFLRKAGYKSQNVWFQVYMPDLINDPTSYYAHIDSLGKIGGYYFDEPISRKFSFVDFLKFVKHISDKGFYPNASIYISELDERKAIKFKRVVDGIMYSAYGAIEKGGRDQVESWKNWREVLGSLFNMLWIGAHEDYNEYDLLFQTAKEMNVDGVWLYALEPIEPGKEVDSQNYINYCEAAVKHGFMKRIK